MTTESVSPTRRAFWSGDIRLEMFGDAEQNGLLSVFLLRMLLVFLSTRTLYLFLASIDSLYLPVLLVLMIQKIQTRFKEKVTANVTGD